MAETTATSPSVDFAPLRQTMDYSTADADTKQRLEDAYTAQPTDVERGGFVKSLNPITSDLEQSPTYRMTNSKEWAAMDPETRKTTKAQFDGLSPEGKAGFASQFTYDRPGFLSRVLARGTSTGDPYGQAMTAPALNPDQTTAQKAADVQTQVPSYMRQVALGASLVSPPLAMGLPMVAENLLERKLAGTSEQPRQMNIPGNSPLELPGVNVPGVGRVDVGHVAEAGLPLALKGGITATRYAAGKYAQPATETVQEAVNARNAGKEAFVRGQEMAARPDLDMAIRREYIKGGIRPEDLPGPNATPAEIRDFYKNHAERELAQIGNPTAANKSISDIISESSPVKDALKDLGAKAFGAHMVGRAIDFVVPGTGGLAQGALPAFTMSRDMVNMMLPRFKWFQQLVEKGMQANGTLPVSDNVLKAVQGAVGTLEKEAAASLKTEGSVMANRPSPVPEVPTPAPVVANELAQAKAEVGKLFDVNKMSDAEVMSYYRNMQQGTQTQTVPLPAPPQAPGQYANIKSPDLNNFAERNPFEDSAHMPTQQMTQPLTPDAANSFTDKATQMARNQLLLRSASPQDRARVLGLSDDEVRQLYRQVFIDPFKGGEKPRIRVYPDVNTQK